MPQTHGVPAEIAAAPMRTVRPIMLRGLYANPEKELIRMRDRGHVVRIAPGTYTAKPDTIPAETKWLPDFEEAAMAYATAHYGNRVPVLYGIGAARFHHAIPRAIGATVIAVPEQHRPITLEAGGGRVVFTRTEVNKLDARLERGGLGRFLVTTPEETLLDLLDRPELGGMPAEAATAVRTLLDIVDQDRVHRLAIDRTCALRERVRRVLLKMAEAMPARRKLEGPRIS